MKVEGEEPVHLRHDDPSEEVDLGVEDEPLEDGTEEGAGQLEDDELVDSPEQTEDRDVDQGVQFKDVNWLQIMSVFPVDIEESDERKRPGQKILDQRKL